MASVHLRPLFELTKFSLVIDALQMLWAVTWTVMLCSVYFRLLLFSDPMIRKAICKVRLGTGAKSARPHCSCPTSEHTLCLGYKAAQHAVCTLTNKVRPKNVIDWKPWGCVGSQPLALIWEQ